MYAHDNVALNATTRTWQRRSHVRRRRRRRRRVADGAARAPPRPLGRSTVPLVHVSGASMCACTARHRTNAFKRRNASDI
eukprot:6209209-Pleurochrysis_carterae.AAC.2